jgi:hypothetical protein
MIGAIELLPVRQSVAGRIYDRPLGNDESA